MFNTSTWRQSRRSAISKTKADQPIIAFKLDKHWFALPILAIQKVISLSQINRQLSESKIDIYQYKNQELLIIDIAQHIIGNSSPFTSEINTNSSLLKSSKSIKHSSFYYVAILQQETELVIGLPLNSQPVMYKVKQSDFQALTTTELDKYNFQCVDNKITNIEEIPILFVLNPKQLIKSTI